MACNFHVHMVLALRQLLINIYTFSTHVFYVIIYTGAN